MSKDDEDVRITELESRVTFQEETIEQLNTMVTKQWQEIEKLQKMLKRLDDQLYALESQADSPKGSEPPPPHY